MAKREKDFVGAAERSIRDLREDFDKRIDEIKDALKEKGPEAIEKVEESLNDLKADLENRLGDIHEDFEDRLETGRKEIQKHPLLAVGAAVAVGVIIGMLFGRKGKD